MFQKLFLTLLALWLIFNQQAAGNSHQNLQTVDAFLQAQVKANRIPGMAVAIVKGYQVAFIKGYGMAAPGNPVTPQTQFYIGSISKSFTALATLQLVEQGKLDLDAPIQNYLPWFQVADSLASTQITVRHLLNHTSGLSKTGDPNASVNTSSLKKQAQLLKDAQLTAPIGNQFQYYNQNYRLVGLLIETVSGQSYSNYLQDNIFKPLGMTHSVTNPTNAPSLAQGYSRFFGFPLPQSQHFVPSALPSGYLISTAEDMAQYLLAQLNNRQLDGKTLLQPESLAAMRTPPDGIKSEYGMGWMVMENGNMLVHGGALEYFQSFVALDLEEKTGLVILYNQNSLENMMLANDAIRDGLLALLNNETPSQMSFGWVGWLLLSLAIADLLNHFRLYRMLPSWIEKTSEQPRIWLWGKVLTGILLPLVVIFGLPPLATNIMGGNPTWAEPFKLAPDLVIWLLLGMSLTLVRSSIYAMILLRQKTS